MIRKHVKLKQEGIKDFVTKTKYLLKEYIASGGVSEIFGNLRAEFLISGSLKKDLYFCLKNH